MKKKPTNPFSIYERDYIFSKRQNLRFTGEDLANFLRIHNCVTSWRWVPGVFRGFHFWHSQPLDKVMPSMAGKPAPSSHEPPCQWSQAPVTLIYQWKNKWGRDGGKRMIQRLNEESGRQENVVLSTLEVMQARLTALYPNDWPLTTPSLLVINCVK